jgi:hypothetical protein
MIKLLLRQWFPLVSFAVIGAFFLASPSSLSAARPPRPAGLHVSIEDTGKTIALPVGEQLIVTLPLARNYQDDTWSVTSNSNGVLKLIAGPDEIRGRNWTPWKASSQVFYFQREAPGTAHLVLERKYWARPMILDVVDR